MPLDLPGDIAVDLRQPVVGDSFGWEEIEPGAAKKSIVIHATASQSPIEDGFVVADYHVNHNGWGGVGVHFVVTKDEYPGKPNFSNAGAQVHYVGDLYTWRAGTLGQNTGRIHIEISGLFTPGNGVPSESQLRHTRRLIDHLLTQTPELPSLNYYSQVTYHNAVPNQNTECPGWQHPQFAEWFKYLQGGPEPSWWTPPAPVTPPPSPTPPPAPVPTPDPTPTPGMGNGQVQGDVPVAVAPPGIVNWTEIHETRSVMRDGAYAVDVPNGEAVIEATKPHLLKGTAVSVWGYFTFNGNQYARTEYATTHKTWTGIPLSFLQPPDVPDILDHPDLAKQLQDGFLQLPVEQHPTLWQLLAEMGAVTLSPVLRLLGIIKKGKS